MQYVMQRVSALVQQLTKFITASQLRELDDGEEADLMNVYRGEELLSFDIIFKLCEKSTRVFHVRFITHLH
jgi:hypothetical protein